MRCVRMKLGEPDAPAAAVRCPSQVGFVIESTWWSSPSVRPQPGPLRGRPRPRAQRAGHIRTTRRRAGPACRGVGRRRHRHRRGDRDPRHGRGAQGRERHARVPERLGRRLAMTRAPVGTPPEDEVATPGCSAVTTPSGGALRALPGLGLRDPAPVGQPLLVGGHGLLDLVAVSRLELLRELSDGRGWSDNPGRYRRTRLLRPRRGSGPP